MWYNERIRTERRHRWEQSELAKYEAKGKKPPKNWQDKYKEPEPIDASELPTLPDGWIWTNVDHLASIKHGFAFKSKNFVDDGPIVLTPGNFTADGFLDFTTKRVVRHNPDFDDEWILPSGSLVVVMTDLSQKKLILGAASIVEGDEPILHNQRIGLVEPYSSECGSEFLRYAIMRPGLKAYLDDTATGTLISHTSPSRILAGLVPLPPLDEQAEIVRRIDGAVECRDAIACELAESESSLTQLDQSILAKAFRGELVPQDPRDEPASKLLARIRTAREQAETNRKAGKKTSRKKATRKRTKKSGS